MRVAYLCNLYPAVSHSFVRREIEGVEAAGHKVYRFSLRASAGLKDPADLREAVVTQSILAQGVFVLLIAWLTLLVARPTKSLAALRSAMHLSSVGLKSKLLHLAYLLEAAWLTRRLSQLRAEHLHAHFGTNPAAVAVLVRALGGPPFSFTVHGPDEFDAPLALSLGAKIEAAAFVVGVSSFGRSQIMRWSKVDQWDKIKVVRCGVDQTFLDEQIEPVTDGGKEFVCVARLSAQKGLPLLIAACDRLRADGERFSLTIIGEGEMRTELAADIGRRGLDNMVEMVGSRSSEEIRRYLRRAVAFVLPSFAEGLPVVLMEALALGRPVITTAIAGIPELVDSSCGWLIPAGSADSIVQAMKTALDATASDLRDKGEVGRQIVQVMHNARRNSAELAGLMVQASG